MPAEAITQPEVKATPTEVAPAAVVQPPAVTPPAVVPPAEEPQKAPEKAADTKPEDKPAEVFNLKIPEGKEVDSEMLGAFSTTAQQLGIANEQAQKLLDTMSPVIESRLQQKMLDAQTATVDAWGQQLAEDPVLGGRNLERTINAANAASYHWCCSAVGVGFGRPRSACVLVRMIESSSLGSPNFSSLRLSAVMSFSGCW